MLLDLRCVVRCVLQRIVRYALRCIIMCPLQYAVGSRCIVLQGVRWNVLLAIRCNVLFGIVAICCLVCVAMFC